MGKQGGTFIQTGCIGFQKMRLLFDQNAKAARIKAGLSQADVAELTGIPQSRIFKIKLGRVNMTLETMMVLARAVGRDVRFLMTPANT